MARIYFYLYSFLTDSPRKDEEGASGWAATFAPLVPFMALLTIYLGFDWFSGGRLLIKNFKPIVAVTTAILCGWSYWHYHLSGRGKEVVAALRSAKHARRHAIIGMALFFEALFGWVVLAAIVIVLGKQ